MLLRNSTGVAQKLSRRKRGVGLTLALLSFLGVLVGLSETTSAQLRAPIRFIDVAGKAGVTLRNVSGGPRKDYILEAAGNGAAFFDYDDDGDMDLLLVNGSTFEKFKQGGGPMVALYSNDGKGNFLNITGQSGLTKKGWGMGVCVADYDNSGFQDVYVTAYGPNVLFRNKGDGTFADVTERADVGDSHWSTTCAFGDYNRDGYVDLYVANYVAFDEKTTPRRGTSSLCQYRGMDVFCGPRGLSGEPDVLYRNNGDGTFKDVTQSAKIDDPGYYGFGVIFSDVNNDDWPDIYVANDSTPNFLFRNNKDGTFSEVGLEAGVALSEEGRPQAGMGVDVGDYNNDGYFDIFVTNFSEDTNTLYQNNGDETFNVVTSAAGLGRSSLPYLGWGTGLVDLDNDGFLDIFIANGHIYPKIDQFAFGATFLERNQLYQNQGNGRFLELTEELEVGLLTRKSSRGAALATTIMMEMWISCSPTLMTVQACCVMRVETKIIGSHFGWWAGWWEGRATETRSGRGSQQKSGVGRKPPRSDLEGVISPTTTRVFTSDWVRKLTLSVLKYVGRVGWWKTSEISRVISSCKSLKVRA